MFRKTFEFVRSVVSGSTPEERPFPSVVLLLESPRELTEEMALRYSEQAWGGNDGAPSIAGSPHKGSWLIRVSDLLFALRSARGRYVFPRPEANAVRQRAWDQHKAWVVVEYPEGPKTPESEWPSCYKLLLLMVHQLWDDNCLGLYLPAEGVTVPNMGDLISSIRWAGKNGTPLAFLHEG